MKRRRLMVAVLLAAAASVPTGYWWFSREDAPVSLRPDDTRLVALGEALYQANCASCHGARLEGQRNWRERGPDGLLPAPPHDASGHTWHHPDEALFSLTKFGLQPFAGPDYRSAMPAFGDKLSDENILAILSFIKSTWPPEIRQRQDAITEASRKQQDG